MTLSSISIPINERRWIDIEQIFNPGCLEMSKFMIRLLRHADSFARESDGAVKFDDLIGKIKAHFEGILQWTVEAWTKVLAEGGGSKKRFQNCSNPDSSRTFLVFHSKSGTFRRYSCRSYIARQ